MVITMWTVLVALLVHRHVLPERLLTFLAHEGHLGGLGQVVCLGLRVALGAVIPELATWRPDRDLRVQDVFTADG